MDRSQVDEKQVIYDAVKAYIEEVEPSQLVVFELGYDGMYAVIQRKPDEDMPPGADGPSLTVQQLGEATILAAAVWTAKAMFRLVADPLLENRVLPNLDAIEAKIAASLQSERGSRMIRMVRANLERAIRRHLGLPTTPKDNV
jgi:hypothetical protein